MSKILYNISSNNIPTQIDDSQNRVITYKEFLEYYDEIHFICRSTQSLSNRHPTLPIFVHRIKVSNTVTGRIKGYINMFRFLTKLHKDKPVSTVLASEPVIGGVLALLLKKRYGLNYMLEVQAELMKLPKEVFPYMQRKGTKLLTKITGNRALVVRAVSKEVAGQLIDSGVKDDKVRVIPSRVSVDLFDYRYKAKYREEILSKHYLKNNDKIIVAVGRLVGSKGFDNLIKAIKKLKQGTLIIVGGGPLKQDLENLVESLNMSGRVCFTGNIPFKDVPKYIGGSDIFAMSSLDEGFPRVVLEAMASKTLVVATKVGGVNDFCKTGKNGFFCKPNDIEGLYSCLKQALASTDETVTKLTEEAYDLVLQKYEFHTALKGYLESLKMVDETNCI